MQFVSVFLKYKFVDYLSITFALQSYQHNYAQKY